MKKTILFGCLFTGLLSLNNHAANFTLESSAFQPNTMIPAEFTCIGMDKSPPLAWHDAPKDTQSFVLIVDDPDTAKGIWNHWVLFNIPASVSKMEQSAAIPEGAATGTNSTGALGYHGPCPPTGTHHYLFKLYALDQKLNLDKGVTKDVVIQAMTGHVIGNTELVGLFHK